MAMLKYKFMENENWFYYDNEEFFILKLTEEAPEDVYESYKTYLEDCLINEQIDEDDYEYLVNGFEQNQNNEMKKVFGM